MSLADMDREQCNSKEALEQNGLDCVASLRTRTYQIVLQVWEEQEATVYGANQIQQLYLEHNITSPVAARFLLFICLFVYLHISINVQLILFSASGACYFPVEVQGEFMTQSLAHQEISYTRFFFSFLLLFISVNCT